MRPFVIPALLACTLLLHSACSRVRVEAPEGFAEQRVRGEYRAMSPEGIPYRVRSVRNYPKKDLNFWDEALRGHLSDEGYHLLGEGRTFTTDGAEGKLYEWGVPYAEMDYVYLTALIPMGKRIVIIEAAGEHTLYSQYRKGLHESMETISRRFHF